MTLAKIIIVVLSVISSLKSIASSAQERTDLADALIAQVYLESQISLVSHQLKLTLSKTEDPEKVTGALKIASAGGFREIQITECSSNEVLANLMQCQNAEHRLLISVSIGSDKKFKLFIEEKNLDRQNQLMIPPEVLSQK